MTPRGPSWVALTAGNGCHDAEQQTLGCGVTNHGVTKQDLRQQGLGSGTHKTDWIDGLDIDPVERHQHWIDGLDIDPIDPTEEMDI